MAVPRDPMTAERPLPTEPPMLPELEVVIFEMTLDMVLLSGVTDILWSTRPKEMAVAISDADC